MTKRWIDDMPPVLADLEHAPNGRFCDDDCPVCYLEEWQNYCWDLENRLADIREASKNK